MSIKKMFASKKAITQESEPSASPATGLSSSIEEQEMSALMILSQNGDQQSYAQLLHRIEGLMISYVQNRLRQFGIHQKVDSEDIIQEVLLAIHKKRSSYNTEEYFLPWMYAIAKYKTIDFLRTKKIHFTTIDEDFDETQINHQCMSTTMIDHIDQFEFSHDLNILIDQLPDKQKIIIKLVKIEGLSITETAEQTGFSESDIKVTIHRAFKNLQDILKEIER